MSDIQSAVSQQKVDLIVVKAQTEMLQVVSVTLSQTVAFHAQLEVMIRLHEKDVTVWVQRQIMIAEMNDLISEGLQAPFRHCVADVNILLESLKCRFTLNTGFDLHISETAEMMLKDIIETADLQSWKHHAVDSDSLFSVSEVRVFDDRHEGKEHMTFISAAAGSNVCINVKLFDLVYFMTGEVNMRVLSDLTEVQWAVDQVEVTFVNGKSDDSADEAVHVSHLMNDQLICSVVSLKICLSAVKVKDRLIIQVSSEQLLSGYAVVVICIIIAVDESEKVKQKVSVRTQAVIQLNQVSSVLDESLQREVPEELSERCQVIYIVSD